MSNRTRMTLPLQTRRHARLSFAFAVVLAALCFVAPLRAQEAAAADTVRVTLLQGNDV